MFYHRGKKLACGVKLDTVATMKTWNKGNITLQIRVPPEMAALILGRLYGKGILTREQYFEKLKKLKKDIYK
ncbi:MAG: hypothetical protein IKY15_01715 [Clostridia bacterium]|nr:hypothetical protein [Clostridia bacterium]